jgi:hypothetical protein
LTVATIETALRSRFDLEGGVGLTRGRLALGEWQQNILQPAIIGTPPVRAALFGDEEGLRS